jgi:peptide/nickel transport system permease protein
VTAARHSLQSWKTGRIVGLSVIVVLVVLAVFGDWIAPHDPNEQNIARRLEGPSADYWLGTDHLGRDLVSRLIGGTRVGLSLGVPVIAIALVIGLSLGLASGYHRGRVDTATLLTIDLLAAFPGLILALILIPLLGVSTRALILVLSLAFIPPYVRVTRASTLGVKERGFVLAERALGASSWRITSRHILPNIIRPIVVLAAIDLPFVIVAEAGLSFLGLGVPPPDPSWGSMLFEGFSRVRDAPGPVLWPAAAIAITTIAFTLVGESFGGSERDAAETARLERVT